MNRNNEFTPKLVTILKDGVSLAMLRKEIFSGVVVGIVALPLAIAFAIASGVSPDKGLVTAVIAGFIISILGGSRVQIGGPTGAFIIIVYGIVQQYGVDGLILATLMAGVILILIGITKLGSYIQFIPYPLVVGFTSAIAVVIFSTQVNDFLGLGLSNLPGDFIGKWKMYAANVGSIDMWALGTALLSIAFIVTLPKINRQIPSSLVAIVVTTAAVAFFKLPLETIASRFGEIPSSIPAPSLPNFDFNMLKGLIAPAIAIALLGAIESLLSAVVSDGMIGGRHRSNMELIAQGFANIGSAFFGGIPATGAIARTATNVNAGGRTPIAGIVHATTLLIIMVTLGSYAGMIPLATLAGVLTVVSYKMSEWRNFASLLKSDRIDILVLLSTFFLTLFFDLVLAIEVGIVLSALLFMKRMGSVLEVDLFNDDSDEKPSDYSAEDLPDDFSIYEINGPLFFGATRSFERVMDKMIKQPRTVLFRMRFVPFIDATGYKSLRDVVLSLKSKGINVYISGLNPSVRRFFLKNKFEKVLPLSHRHSDFHQMLKIAKEDHESL